MNKVRATMLRLLSGLLLYTAMTVLAAPDFNLARIEHDRILQAANAALKQEPVTVTKYRARFSEGGPNDFYSNGDYWWPNPDTTNGLPYILRDGESNPDNFVAHRRCVVALRQAVAALAAAYKITGEDKYVARAAILLNVFFLDPKTRMNPSLKYAQAIPGVSTGRGIGIIDTLQLVEVPLAIEAMEKSPELPPEELAGLRQWFRDYVTWMTTSKNGHDEANTTNNHAVAFWLQVAVFAQFAGLEKDVAESRRHYKDVFVPGQMAGNGSFPRELARTKPYGYSIFQLDNLCLMCQALSTPEDNLWDFQMPDGRGIRLAIAFLYPYLADKNKWLADGHRRDVQSWDGWPVRCPALIFGGLALHKQEYLDLWLTLPAKLPNDEIQRNLAVDQPILWLK